jgi:hypothetical protein
MGQTLKTPTSHIALAHDLRVALYSNGVYDYDWNDSPIGSRLHVQEISTGDRLEYPRALLTVNLTGEYADDGTELVPPLRWGDMQGLINHEQELVIYAAVPSELPGGGSGSREFLFHGYAKTENPQTSGTPGNEFKTCDIDCTSILERFTKDRGSWIVGRYYKDGSGGTLVEAAPCVFNRNNRPNRHPDLVDYEFNGSTIKVPLFTDDNAPSAVYWTYADALTYLIYAYIYDTSSTIQIQDGNGILLCQDTVAANAGPQPLTNPNNPSFADVVTTKCDELNVFCKNVIDAIYNWCVLTRCTFQQYTRNNNGDPVTQLVFSLLGDGGGFTDYGESSSRTLRASDSDNPPAARMLRLEKEGTSALNRLAADVQSKNQLEQAGIIYDKNNIIATARIIGEPERYEVTLGKNCASNNNDVFKPAWVPDGMFGDNLSGASLDTKLEEIKEATGTDADGNALTMFKRYARSGELHNTTHRYTGRLWVLNESGEWDGATYGRSNGGLSIWNSASYDNAYDLHANASVPKAIDRGSGQRTASFLARRRRIGKLLSKGSDGQRRPPLVWCSFDSGGHWYKYEEPYMFVGEQDWISGQIGIFLTTNNLNRIINDKPQATDATEDESVWSAIARGTFRLAITCTIEGDSRMIGESHNSNACDSSSPQACIYVGRELKNESTSGANSELNGAAGWISGDLDETYEAISYADRVVMLNQATRISGNFVIPWLTGDFMPNDLIAGIAPRGPNFKSTAGADRYPRVVRVLWANTPDRQTTHITIDDKRTSVRSV